MKQLTMMKTKYEEEAAEETDDENLNIKGNDKETEEMG